MNTKATISFSKRTLIEAVHQVIAELGVDDVLKPEWQADANADMDIEFYGEQAKLFWEMMEVVVGELRGASPAQQKEWAFSEKFDSSIIQHIPQLLQMVDMKWVHSKLSDKMVYTDLTEYNLDPYSARAMKHFAQIKLPQLLDKYLF